MNLKFCNSCVMLSLLFGQISFAMQSDVLQQIDCVQMKVGVKKVSALVEDLISESQSLKDQHSMMNDVSNKNERIIEASKCGHLKIVESLVKNGMNINFRGGDGLTPLMTASLYGRFSIVEYLVNNGADVNIQADNGSTAAQLAAANGHWEIVNFLQRGSVSKWKVISPFGIILPISD